MSDINVADVDALVRDIFLAFVRVHVGPPGASGRTFAVSSSACLFKRLAGQKNIGNTAYLLHQARPPCRGERFSSCKKPCFD
jgi:hypothetical protein